MPSADQGNNQSVVALASAHLAERNPDFLGTFSRIWLSHRACWIYVNIAKYCWSQRSLLWILLTISIHKTCARRYCFLHVAGPERLALVPIRIINTTETKLFQRRAHLTLRFGA